MDDIINETEDDYKASVKSESKEPDGGVSTLHDHQHWKGLSLESKCDALHHIVSSLPAFKKGKFEYLLDLVCQKEQTTSTSSTSTSSTTAGCPAIPSGGIDGPGNLGFLDSCSQDIECFGRKLYRIVFHASFDHCQPLTDIVSIVFLFNIYISQLREDLDAQEVHFATWAQENADAALLMATPKARMLYQSSANCAHRTCL